MIYFSMNIDAIVIYLLHSACILKLKIIYRLSKSFCFVSEKKSRPIFFFGLS
jgi:hypothetical protein